MATFPYPIRPIPQRSRRQRLPPNPERVRWVESRILPFPSDFGSIMRSGFSPLAVAIVAALLASVPACNRGPTRPRVAVVTNCTANFWSICEAGAKKAAAENDVELTFRQPPSLDVSQQKQIIDTLVQQGPSGIAISVINPEEQTPDLTRIAGKMNLLTMDNDADKTGRLAYIGIDNYEAGKAVGRMIKKAKPDGGDLLLFIGATTSANAKARIGGVLDELAGEKDAKGPQFGKFHLLKGPITDSGDETKALEFATTELAKIQAPEKLVAVGLYAYNPKKILAAAERNKIRGKLTIVGFDEDELTLKGIEDGDIVGTVVQDPFKYGYQSVAILAALARGDKSKLPKPGEMIPYRVVTKDGGPEETVNGVVVQNLKAADFAKQLQADLDSAKK